MFIVFVVDLVFLMVCFILFVSVSVMFRCRLLFIFGFLNNCNWVLGFFSVWFRLLYCMEFDLSLIRIMVDVVVLNCWIEGIGNFRMV